jgi:hypothetical protein
MPTTNEAYAIIDGELVKVADDWTALTDEEKIAIFDDLDEGDPGEIEDIAALGSVRVYSYREDEQRLNVSLKAVPPAKIILPEGLIPTGVFDAINFITFTGVFTAASGGFIKFAFTTDNETYKVYDGSAWQTMAPGDFAAEGMTETQVGALDGAAFTALSAGASGIGIGFYISQEAAEDNLRLDTLTINATLPGTWSAAVHGADFTYSFLQSAAGAGSAIMSLTLTSAGTYKINYDKEAENA